MADTRPGLGKQPQTPPPGIQPEEEIKMANEHPVAHRFLACSAAGLLTLASGSTLASSFALIEQSVSGMGSAYAIGSAGINDASTVFLNPAGMSRLSGTHINGGLQAVYSQVEFDGSAEYSPLTGGLAGTDIAGITGIGIAAGRETLDDLSDVGTLVWGDFGFQALVAPAVPVVAEDLSKTVVSSGMIGLLPRR